MRGLWIWLAGRGRGVWVSLLEEGSGVSVFEWSWICAVVWVRRWSVFGYAVWHIGQFVAMYSADLALCMAFKSIICPACAFPYRRLHTTGLNVQHTSSNVIIIKPSSVASCAHRRTLRPPYHASPNRECAQRAHHAQQRRYHSTIQQCL